MKRLTIAQVAERLDIENDHARGFVMLLVEKEIIKHAGVKPLKIGRSANVYEFPDGFEDGVIGLLHHADLSH